MNNSRATKRRITTAALLSGAAVVCAQQPFDLDQTFGTTIQEVYISSIALMPDGKLLVSGEFSFSGQPTRYLARLNNDGTEDTSYPDFVWAGGSKITPWSDRYYVNRGGFTGKPDRLLPNGLVDGSFDISQSGVFTNQGGDYHVYPDGSVVITGSHTVNVPDSGWTGSHHMIWFNNDGTLDLTRQPRKGNGAIYLIVPQPDGKFLLSGAATTWEGVPVAQTFRVHPDGTLDQTFNAAVTWGEAQGITVLPDGRLVVSGLMKTEFTSPDTLHLVRLFPDGAMDPSFNNQLVIRSDQFDQFLFLRHTYLPGFGIALHGNYDEVEGHARGGFIIVNEDGFLQEPLDGGGCGEFLDFAGIYRGGTMGMLVAPDGFIYIHGAYHGYDDGTTNDPTQRFVSRLYGLNVGVQERDRLAFKLYPNPTNATATVVLARVPSATTLIVRDALGRELLRQRVSERNTTLQLNHLSDGIYTVQLVSAGRLVAHQKLVVQR